MLEHTPLAPVPQRALDRRVILVAAVFGALFGTVAFAPFGRYEGWPGIAPAGAFTGLLTALACGLVLRAGRAAWIAPVCAVLGVLNGGLGMASLAASHGGATEAAFMFFAALTIGAPVGVVLGLLFGAALAPLLVSQLRRRARGQRVEADATLAFWALGAAALLRVVVRLFAWHDGAPVVAVGFASAGLVSLGALARLARTARWLARVEGRRHAAFFVGAPAGDALLGGAATRGLHAYADVDGGPFRDRSVSHALGSLPAASSARLERRAWMLLTSMAAAASVALA